MAGRKPPGLFLRKRRCLEVEAEAELQRARRIREVRILVRLQERRAALIQHVRSEVRTIERVEQLDHPVERHPATQPEPLLQTEVDAMNRVADELVPRNDGAVRTE